MSRLTRDGTAEPFSRDQILRHARGQGNIIFPVQLTTSRIGNLTRLIHTLLYAMTIHTYIHTYPCLNRTIQRTRKSKHSKKQVGKKRERESAPPIITYRAPVTWIREKPCQGNTGLRKCTEQSFRGYKTQTIEGDGGCLLLFQTLLAAVLSSSQDPL